MTDKHAALLREEWKEESLDLIDKLQTNLGEDWKIIMVPTQFRDQIFESGNIMNFIFFLNKAEKCVKGVAQFGPHTIGRQSVVHGGAIAMALDNVMGACCECSTNDTHILTANLSVNYKKSVQTREPVYIEGRLDKISGRKRYLSSVIKNANGTEVYADATSLFLSLKSSI